jgi:hypothetical protein
MQNTTNASAQRNKSNDRGIAYLQVPTQGESVQPTVVRHFRLTGTRRCRRGILQRTSLENAIAILANSKKIVKWTPTFIPLQGRFFWSDFFSEL